MADVDMADDDGMNDEAYDTINAPQFLDFSQLDAGEGDEAEADRFFANHKEEDDYFTPSETTFASPNAVPGSEKNQAQEKPLLEENQNTEAEPDANANEESNTSKLNSEDEEVKENGHSAVESTEDEQEEKKGQIEQSFDANSVERSASAGRAGKSENGSQESTDKSENMQEDEEDVQQIATPEESVEGPSPSEYTEQVDDNGKDDKQEMVDVAVQVHKAEQLALNQPINEIVNMVNENDEVPFEDKPLANQIQNLIQPEVAAIPINQSETLVPNEEKKKKTAPSLPAKKKDFKLTVPQPFKFNQGRTKADATEKKPTDAKVAGKVFAQPKKVATNIKANIKSNGTRSDDKEEKKAAPLKRAPSNESSNNMSASMSASTSSIKSTRPSTPKRVTPASTPTKVQPFSFELRDKELQRKKQLKMQEKLEQQIQSFKFVANPVPSFQTKKTVQSVKNAKPVVNGERNKENGILKSKPTIPYAKKPFKVPLVNGEKKNPEGASSEENSSSTQNLEEQATQTKPAPGKSNPVKPLRAFHLKNSLKPLTNPRSPQFGLLPSQRRLDPKTKKVANDSKLNSTN